MAKSSNQQSAAPGDNAEALSASAAAAPHYDRDRVATRAYELYMARGGSDGSDLEDWLTAERECCPQADDAGDPGE
jgi:hypothetical protein